MKVIVTSVMVNDQAKALKFYTEVLGFIEKTNIPMGQYSWLTVVSPEGGDVEVLLEPTAFEPAKVYKQQLYSAGIAATMFGVDDVQAEYERLLALGVTFVVKPTNVGTAVIATFDDTCGNLITIAQKVG